MSKGKKGNERPREVRNAKVHRNYFIGETYEAGLKLTGTEVKSVRAGRAQINESFARIEKGDKPTLYHAHIDEYKFGNENNHNPTRPRLLLLHKKEILKIRLALEAGGQALIPTRLYFKGGLIKIELALCTGKKLYDKREDLKKKEALREAQRAMSARHR